MLDRISEENCDDRDMITKHFPRVSLDAPAYTPWFDTWMKYYLQTLPVAEHEFLKHSLGCIFVVSTRSELRTLHTIVEMSSFISFILCIIQLCQPSGGSAQPVRPAGEAAARPGQQQPARLLQSRHPQGGSW